MAAVGVARGVRVVLEEQDVAGDPVLAQALFRLVEEILDDPLARLVVDDELDHVVALGRRVLGMEPGVEVQPGAVLEEHVRVACARDHFLEEIAGDVVRRESALSVQRAGETVLVLEAEDPALHGPRLTRLPLRKHASVKDGRSSAGPARAVGVRGMLEGAVEAPF